MMMKKIIFLSLALASLSLSSCKQDSLDFELPTPPGIPQGQQAKLSLTNPADEGAILAVLNEDVSTVELKLTINKRQTDYTPTVLGTENLANYVKAYAQTLGVPELTPLPDDQIEIIAPTIKAGETEGKVIFNLKHYQKLDYGTYYAPVVIKDGLIEESFLIRVDKDGEYVKLTEEHKKPLPPNYNSYTEPLKMVAYVETNDYDIRNMGQFILKDTKEPIFDMVVLFAANMNYDRKKDKRYIFFNDKLQPIIKNPEIYIKPLTDRGIKVIIDILPNHQGVGYHNFQNYEEALEFAKEAKMWTDKLGIDGWDIDEEYAEYNKLPEYPYTRASALWYIKAMKEVMPDKLLTCYDYNNPLSAGQTDSDGKTPKDYLDFIVSDYWVQGANSLGMSPKKYAAYSVEANRVGTHVAERSAKYNLDSGNGGMMIFAIKGPEIANGKTAKDLSKATKLFYGQECIFSGKYHKGPKDYGN